MEKFQIALDVVKILFSIAVICFIIHLWISRRKDKGEK